MNARRVTLDDSPEAIDAYFAEQGWSDGLPIVPPTPERVEAFVAAAGGTPERELGAVPPRNGIATLEKLAINSVMAGCRPEYFPVITTAIAAMLEEPFNLYGVQSTTHPCAPLVVVNGPLARRLELNARYNCFGPGWRANATIGRAIRLILLNVGGAAPGVLDRATQGQPSKYAFCIAENEEENPWSPLHVERGFAPDDSTVTVCGAENPHNINDHVSDTAEGILVTVAASMANMGCNNAYLFGEPILALGPEHAALLERDGVGKDEIRRFVFEHARIPRAVWERGGMFGMSGARTDLFPDANALPILRRPEDLIVIVAGGPGRHSSWLPTFGAMTRAVTRRIESSA